MATDFQPTLTSLIAQCEGAIRRGDAPHPDKLHTLQRHLVTARDAPSDDATTEHLRTAIHFYRMQIPQEIRRTDLADLTEEFERLSRSLDVDSGDRSSSAETAADD